MYKIFKSDKDTYVTNRVINGIRTYNSNVGNAGTIDLFKIYGATFEGDSPNIELSRGLIHFDISEAKNLFEKGKIDPTHPSFFAHLKLFDVYGGQPTPNKFNLIVSPLSKSFEEGHGRDVTFYADLDVSNFFTASLGGTKWISPGCNNSGSLGTVCDFFTGSLEETQYFLTGEEDINVDITPVLSGVLAGQIPDSGFRISFSQSEEEDQRTYFVKRFASRHAFDQTKRPQLIVGFDDSIQDTTQGMTFDSRVTSFLFNYDKGVPRNLSQNSNELTGSNCIALILKLPISGGVEQFIFTGSQHHLGSFQTPGMYSASILLPSDNVHIKNALSVDAQKVLFTPIWTSLDGNKVFVTGSTITVHPSYVAGNYLAPKRFTVSTYGLKDLIEPFEKVVTKVNIFDNESPFVKSKKIPVNSLGNLQGLVTDAFYSVRDVNADYAIIPFDYEKGSTRLSSDLNTMFFELDASNLIPTKSYVIDVMLIVGNEKQIYKNTSSVFKINKT